jgi:hypothetical protein
MPIQWWTLLLLTSKNKAETVFSQTMGIHLNFILIHRFSHIYKKKAFYVREKRLRTFVIEKNSVYGFPKTSNNFVIGGCNHHRNQTISRKGAYIISHGHLAHRCCPQAFLRIFPEVTYIRTVGNSTLLKIYTLPNHTITIGVWILETQLLGLLYGGGASFVQK